MTEVERYVRERVAATGEPCLMAPGAPPYRRAGGDHSRCHLRAHHEDGSYILAIDLPSVVDLEKSRRLALLTVRSCIRRRRMDGVSFKAGCIEATALGLSLLQLELNRAGSQIVLRLHP